MQANSIIPLGFCQCGCGQKTTISRKDNKRFGHTKGTPRDFVHGHNGVKPDINSRIHEGSRRIGECTVWTGQRTPRGYGTISYKGKVWYVHRLVWLLTNGPIPAGLHVLHSCDNPPCCNPAHLFMGSALDNMHDMAAKGRDNFFGRKPKTSHSASSISSAVHGDQGNMPV